MYSVGQIHTTVQAKISCHMNLISEKYLNVCWFFLSRKMKSSVLKHFSKHPDSTVVIVKMSTVSM